MKKRVVTIARQYGSGGREIGSRVAELLGVPLYDEELTRAAAEAGNLHPEVAENADERATESLLYNLALGMGFHAPGQAHLPVNDRLFLLQSDYIRARAEEGGVFIGRCSDYILRANPSRYSLFVHAPLMERRARIMTRHPELSEGAALDLIRKTDRRRASYYSFYTGGKWGKSENYHMMLDSHALGIEGSAAVIAEAVKRFTEEDA